MPLHLTKLTSLLILAFLIGCSSGDGGVPTTFVSVSADDANNGSTASTDTDTGIMTDAPETIPNDPAASDGTSTAGESDTAGAVTTSGTEDADAGTDSTAGAATDGATTTAGTTDGANTDAGADDAATGSETNGTTDDTGTTTDGTATATDGTTAGTDTDAGATDGTTSGTDTDGTGTTTSNTNDYIDGSLAAVLNNDSTLSSAFEAIQDANLDLAIDDPGNEFTLFLPTNDAIEALASSSDFVLLAHTASGSVSSTTLSTFNGRGLLMDDGQRLVVEGGGTEPLTIAGSELIRTDIMGNASLSVVHVIDTVIGENTDSDSPYEEGSLADVLFNRGDVTNALAALELDGLAESLNDLSLEWTVFLPNDTALEDPADFNSQVHIYTLGANDSQVLELISGLPLVMNSGDLFDIGGGETEDLTIGGATIVEADVQNEDGDGMIVHIIDDVLVPQ